MENIKTAVDFVEFWCPQKSADSFKACRVQEEGFGCCNKALQAVCLADIKRVVLVRIVCGDEIIFAIPEANVRVGTVAGNREIKMFLMNFSSQMLLAFF